MTTTPLQRLAEILADRERCFFERDTASLFATPLPDHVEVAPHDPEGPKCREDVRGCDQNNKRFRPPRPSVNGTSE